MNPRKLGLAVLVVLLAGAAAAAWILFSRQAQENADVLARDAVAADVISHQRPVHRQPARPGSVTQCLESLLGHFSSISPSRTQEEWDENRAICLGRLPVSALSEVSRKRIAEFAPWRGKVFECLHETRVPPGIASRFDDSAQEAAQALDSLQVQVHLSSCAVVAALLDEGRFGAALSECADSFAFLRDEVILGVAARAGDADSMGVPLAVLCGAAIDRSTSADRATFGAELRAIRAGLPPSRETAERQRVRLSLWRYRPLMAASSRSLLPSSLQANGRVDDVFASELGRKLGWSSSDRLLRAAVAEADQPATPDRKHRFQEMYRAITRGTFPGDDRAMLQVIDEIESWERFDAALAMLAAAADFDVRSPNPQAASEFAVDVDAATARFRLLVPEPSQALVVLRR